jgi:hypothetical protein
MELRIDPEFESKIPPLTTEEYQLLEQNILSEGAVINPLIVWDGVIVDGHNRFRIIETHPEITYITHEKGFADRYAAIAWICKNQLGRRNLTSEQRKYLIGKQYEAEKATNGARDGFRGNQYSTVVGYQNDNLPKAPKTCERIAKENHVGRSTVIRAEHFAKAVDAAEEAAPGIRQEILSGAIKPTEKEVASLARAAPEERERMAEELRKPKPKAPKSEKAKGPTDIQKIEKISTDMLSPRGKGTQEDMLYELSDAMESMVFRWTLCLNTYSVYFQKPHCRVKVKQLIQETMDFLKQIEGGTIPK